MTSQKLDYLLINKNI